MILKTFEAITSVQVLYNLLMGLGLNGLIRGSILAITVQFHVRSNTMDFRNIALTAVLYLRDAGRMRFSVCVG